VFSIGFGPELFGRTDRAGTRWKVSALPLGGYVKMHGDADATSSTIDLTSLPDPDSFPSKSVWRRMAIVAAGPLANFVFAIAALALLFATVGRPLTPAEVGGIQPDSPAAAAGLQPGDRIVAVGGAPLESFEELQAIVRTSPGDPLTFSIEREGGPMEIVVTPERTQIEDRFGQTHEIGLIGVTRTGVVFERSNPLLAIGEGAGETVRLIGATLEALGQMVVGSRTTEELGGPLRIAQMSGEIAKDGVVPVIWFTAVLSINLGLINLFPIPMLDGGHLVMYAIEALRGRPLNERSQEVAFRFGLAFVLSLMVFATWNDLVQLNVIEFFKGLVS
jgi:regulator of sigma E protease